MPQTLTLGSNDPDVILLQTTLNNRPPTALALLLVDGNFGLITLQRVQEFQTNNGLLVDGIVGPLTWGTLLPNNPAPKQTFYTEGRYLFDRLGNKVILRGINKMSVFDQDPDPAGSVSFPEIRKTGANTVRIVWAIRTSLENSINLGYPLIVGEFSKFVAYTGLGKSVCTTDGEVDYQAVIEVCDQNEIGWYAWEWGPGNDQGQPGDPLCVVMDMTPDRLFANLKPGWPEEVAISSSLSE
jgi:Putative peptidoglycan binding domain